MRRKRLCYTRYLVQCPKCRNSELDESGGCPVCDARIETATPVEEVAHPEDAHIAADNLEEHGPNLIYDRPSEGDRLPQWRLDLNRRLQKIKQERGALEKTANTGQLSFPQPELTLSRSTPSAQRSRVARKAPRRVTQQASQSPEPESAQKLPYRGDPTPLLPDSSPERGSVPETSKIASADTEEPETAKVASADTEESIPLSNPVEIENLIDSVIAREAIQTRPSERPSEVISPAEARDEGRLEKLILLSRTLSGLVDLIIVFLCGSAFILLADMASGIIVFDFRSVIHYSLLLVAIFFVYSLFFLGTANQTIGMMITNLRVVGKVGNRPTFVRLLIRCAVYLLSLLGLGAGLIFGFFDADSDCLQDKISQTHVVRLA